MDQKWIPILAILVFCQQTTSGAAEDKILREGQLQVQIKCVPSVKGTMVIWFRVLDTSGMEFIASFSNNGVLKTPTDHFTATFSDSMIHNDVLILRSFSKARDSGVYSCASLIKGNELTFGSVTRLVGEEVSVEAPPATTQQSPCTTATPCVCTNKRGETSPEMFCSSIILGPLAGGCGLLLLLLIITSLYCNHVRTRRCPHHHKRKPRLVTPGNKQMTNRHG